jgi:hypothetical protein
MLELERLADATEKRMYDAESYEAKDSWRSGTTNFAAWGVSDEKPKPERRLVRP